MSEERIPAWILDRLRANLRGAGIRIADADIAGMNEKGFLKNVMAFEEVAAGGPPDALPDYVADWRPHRPVAAAGSLGTPSGTDVHSIAQIAPLVRNGEVSPVELTERALSAIQERDAHLNAFQLVLTDEATERARVAEREIADGRYRGALHGVPVAVKDLLAMRGTVTTAGSKILAEWIADRDATAVERLIAAGAVIVGKTRMSEFAYSPGSNNAHYGPTRHPWNPDRDAGGSSSGSAAAVADGLVFGAVGTDTGGSVRIPAALCGIVGLKPTFGRTSLAGAVPLAWSLDHLGPITRTVPDAILMLAALEGHDERDARTRRCPAIALPPDGAAGVRVGVVMDNGVASGMGTAEALQAWREGLVALERNGAELVELEVPEMAALWTLNGAVLALEAAAYHEPMLRTRLDDYGEFMRQRILSAYAYGPHSFVRAQQARAISRRRLEALLDSIDLLTVPTVPHAAPPLGVPTTTMHTAPFNLLGWPSVTVPVGLTSEGLPLAMQLAGRPWDDASVLAAAALVEAADPGRLRSRRRLGPSPPAGQA